MPAKALRVTALLCLAAACSSGTPPKTASLTSSSHSQASLQANSHVSTGSIHWQPCNQLGYSGWFDAYTLNIDDLQCATIETPIAGATDSKALKTVNDARSTSTQPARTIKLALSRLPATGDKIGTLISIAGGPGQSGLDVYPNNSADYTRLREHFDIIGFAPRGVYPSMPSVTCDPKHRVLYPEDSEAFAKGCWQHTPNDLLMHLGANYSVDDIEAIRQALAEPKISLIGYSYGTKIAALYAERYPDKLRAGVLDGIVNLNEDELQIQLNQEASVQQTFERFVEQCRQEPGCFFADTETIKEAEAKIAKIYSYFDNHDIRDLDGQRISPTHLSWTLYGLMGWPDGWPVLNEILSQLEVHDFTLLKSLIDDDKNNIDFATFTAIDCADRAPSEAQKQHYLENAKQVTAQSTWDNHRPATKNELLDACYYWPVVGSDKVHVPKLDAAAPTLLLVAQTNDPATPYKNALAMQQYLDAALLTRRGDGHTLSLSSTSQCVDQHVVDYLINPDNIKDKRAASGGNKINIFCDD